MSAKSSRSTNRISVLARSVQSPGASPIRRSVAATFAGILEARHPGTRWLPRLGTQRDALARSRQVVNVLAPPDELDAIGDVFGVRFHCAARRRHR